MKFSIPKTLTESVSPTLLINWIFGLGVIEYPIGRPRRIASVFCLILNFFIYLGFLRMANLSEIVTLQKSKIGSNSFRLMICLESMSIVTSMCLAQIKAKDTADVISKLTVINHKMDTLGISNDYKLFFKDQIIQLGSGFTLITILMVLFLKHIPTVSPSESSHIGYSLANYYWVTVAFIIDHTFSSIVRYFRNRFQRLNAILMESEMPKRRDSKTVPSYDRVSYFSVIREIHGSDPSSIRAANKQWLLYVIRETRKTHLGLWKMAMRWNRVFGIQMLLSIALTFGQLTTLVYTFYTIAVEKFSISLILSNWIQKTIAVMWLTYHAMKVIMIVDACETTSHEANRTGKLVSKLLDTPACDKDIRDEINIFSLQLLQNPLKFTAYGFFTLDYSLVHGMIGSVTTYLVIMIQMRSIYDSNTVDFSLNSTILIPINITD